MPPAWHRYMKWASSSDVGIWHEAYEVQPESSHILYVNIPPSLMGKATTWTPASRMPLQPVRRKPVSQRHT